MADNYEMYLLSNRIGQDERARNATRSEWYTQLGQDQGEAAANASIQNQFGFGDKMGLLGDQLRDAGSALNQQNLRNMSAQFNQVQPNYFEIAASQGYGGNKGGLAAMQQTAAQRHAGLLTNANFGNMMNENQKTALSYYGAQTSAYTNAGQLGQSKMGLNMQDKWKTAELEEQKREFDASQPTGLDALASIGMGVAGSFTGGMAGALGKGLLDKWFPTTKGKG